ncbi:MAG: ribonuclease R, partial [Clostridia bacterium]|nr:ribonuclease R [Clostridia bacterium]
MYLKDAIYEKFVNGEFEYKGAKRIFQLLDAKSNYEKDSVRSILDSLEDEGKIVYVDGKYLLVEHSNLIKGELKGNERGFAFLIPHDKSVEDFFIPSSNLHGALHKDTVLIKKVISKRGSSDEGEVVKILSRGVTTFVGTYQKEENFGFVIADDKNYFTDVYVPFKKSRGAKNGDKVVCEITKYPDKRRHPEGIITEILGKKHDFKTEELSIIKNHGYELKFPNA